MTAPAGSRSGDLESAAPPLSPPLQLRMMAGLTLPAIRQAARVFRPRAGSHGLDAGCGVGTHLDVLAARVGPAGRLTALDISVENLAQARDSYELAGEEMPAVDFVQGDIRRLPFDDATFDWVWCVDTLWPGAVTDDPAPVLAEFRRVVKPGGKVALLYWSGQSLLPGHPVLEARLNAVFAENAPYLGDVSAEHHFLRAAEWLAGAGVPRPQGRTFVAEIYPPVVPDTREALAQCYSMLWGEASRRLSPADRADYERLCRPGSPEFIGNLPRYYGLITYTMFWGRFGSGAAARVSSGRGRGGS